MTPAEQRAMAERMRKLGAQAKEPDVRDSYLRLADDWDGLAKEAEDMQRRKNREVWE